MHPRMLGDDGAVHLEIAGGIREHRAPRARDDDVVGKLERQLDVLRHQHARRPPALGAGDGAVDNGDDPRREPFGGSRRRSSTNFR